MKSKINTISTVLISVLFALVVLLISDFIFSYLGNRMRIIVFIPLFVMICVLSLLLSNRSQIYVKIMFAFIIMIVVMVLCVYTLWFFLVSSSKYDDLNTTPVFKNKNVMLIVPHPDDEINTMCGVLETFCNTNSSVSVVFTTNGDSHGTAETRLSEASMALSHYGIKNDNIYYLGFGDQWSTEGKHIYNADSDRIWTSAAGFTSTYGSSDCSPYIQNLPYTRNNYLYALKSLLLEIKPDIVICIDSDTHSEHIATSLLFDEVLADIIKQNSLKDSYVPESVYRAFAYSAAFYGVDDFYSSDNLLSSVSIYDEYASPVNIYLWNDRIRIPVCSSSLSRSLKNTLHYAALCEHASQAANKRATSIINGDAVFWNRNINSMCIPADVFVTSGDGYHLNDIKLYDSENIYDYNTLFHGGTWIPSEDDGEKTATITFVNPNYVKYIQIYDSPSLDDNVDECTIELDDGTVITVTEINKDGSPTRVDIDKQNIKSFSVTINKYEGKNSGFTEIEAFSEEYCPSLSFFKIQNQSDDFVYDYIIDKSGFENFTLYSYNCDANLADYSITCDNPKCSAIISDNQIHVSCPSREECLISLYDSTRTVDCIKVRNPSAIVRFAYLIEPYYYQSLPIVKTTASYNLYHAIIGMVS